MAGAAAAAAGGWKRGTQSVVGRVGAERRRRALGLNGAASSFEECFSYAKGSATSRLSQGITQVAETDVGKIHHVGRPLQQDLDFLLKVADLNEDGDLSPQEAAFGFRVWLSLRSIESLIVDAYASIDVDGSGKLDNQELEPYLVTLNDGEPVRPEEVSFIVDMADSNGDGLLDMKELTYATAVWYCDTSGRRIRASGRSVRTSAKIRSTFTSSVNFIRERQRRCCATLASLCGCGGARRTSASEQPHDSKASSGGSQEPGKEHIRSSDISSNSRTETARSDSIVTALESSRSSSTPTESRNGQSPAPLRCSKGKMAPKEKCNDRLVQKNCDGKSDLLERSMVQSAATENCNGLSAPVTGGGAADAACIGISFPGPPSEAGSVAASETGSFCAGHPSAPVVQAPRPSARIDPLLLPQLDEE